LKDLVSLQTLLVVHKAKHCLLPHGLQTLFTINSETSRRNNDFKQPFDSVSGMKRWNFIENDLKCCSNILQFKNKYKEKIIYIKMNVKIVKIETTMMVLLFLLLDLSLLHHCCFCLFSVV